MINGKTASEIFNSIRQHITAGTLRAEDSLPPVRELASELKVNRNTVAAAYKRLITAGLAQSLGRNGTVIKGSPSPVALEGGDPHTPLRDLSGGQSRPAALARPQPLFCPTQPHAASIRRCARFTRTARVGGTLATGCYARRRRN
ncbi:transcriptional regulator [Salmonella enterica subsp. arizonae]|uniref:Transcriptional regulator n=1 Tax=Salmonella enterica subsp. arizonae TaxID=59203 RepID=A0A379T7G9_SALER|nr:transcriptional regulator [Salmonella enterica subsp. arizonae]